MPFKTLRKIEIEFRAILNRKRYRELHSFLNENAQDLGEDNKDVFFFVLKDKLLKVVNNISKKGAAIVLKLNRIGRGADFEELEISISPTGVEDAVKIFKALALTDVIIHSFQKRRNYFYKGVQIALKFSAIWGYHVEFDKLISRRGEKKAAEKKIKTLARALNVRLMTNKELAQFVKSVEEKYRRR